MTTNNALQRKSRSSLISLDLSQSGFTGGVTNAPVGCHVPGNGARMSPVHQSFSPTSSPHQLNRALRLLNGFAVSPLSSDPATSYASGTSGNSKNGSGVSLHAEHSRGQKAAGDDEYAPFMFLSQELLEALEDEPPIEKKQKVAKNRTSPRNSGAETTCYVGRAGNFGSSSSITSSSSSGSGEVGFKGTPARRANRSNSSVLMSVFTPEDTHVRRKWENQRRRQRKSMERWGALAMSSFH